MSDIHCFYVSEGLLTGTHVKRIGGSLWEFLWLISHETKMEGRVLNGHPITISRIANELGESFTTAKRNLSRLSREGYVVRKRNSAGKTYTYAIAHSKKWKIHWAESQVKNDLTSGVKNDLTPPLSQARNDPTVGSKMVPLIRKIDNIDINTTDTTCIKCGGTGLYLRMVPSELNPEHQREDWVKCDECQRS